MAKKDRCGGPRNAGSAKVVSRPKASLKVKKSAPSNSVVKVPDGDDKAAHARALKRHGSEEAAKRAIKMKLGCFPKNSLIQNRNADNDSLEAVVRAEVRRCKLHNKYIPLEFWNQQIRAFKLSGSIQDGLREPPVTEPVAKGLDEALRAAHSPNPAQKKRRKTFEVSAVRRFDE